MFFAVDDIVVVAVVGTVDEIVVVVGMVVVTVDEIVVGIVVVTVDEIVVVAVVGFSLLILLRHPTFVATKITQYFVQLVRLRWNLLREVSKQMRFLLISVEMM